jgi:ABC-type multidrug transport system permease subunit
MAEREVYVRELSNHYYYSSPYFLSKVIFDIIPLRVIPPIIIVAISYYWIGLNHIVGRFFRNMLVMVLFNIASGALCIMVGSVAPGVASANIVTIIIIIFEILFAGFPANRKSLTPGVRWITFLSFWSYAIEAVAVNEFADTKFFIKPEGFKTAYIVPGEFLLGILGFKTARIYVDIVVTAAFGFVMLLASGFLLKFCVKEKR